MNRSVTVYNLRSFSRDSDSESKYDVPLTGEKISSIETVSVSRADVEEEKICSICLEDYNLGEEVRKVPCGSLHLFHGECLFAWLQIKKTCPMCREQLKLDKSDSSQNSRQ